MNPNQPRPDWKPLYEEAMRETDLSKLAQRIAIARSCILDHIEESIRNPGLAQHCTMDAALRNLRRLAQNLESAKRNAVA